jgi:hypothetical protein
MDLRKINGQLKCSRRSLPNVGSSRLWQKINNLPIGIR